jgi:hypothetical protein
MEGIGVRKNGLGQNAGMGKEGANTRSSSDARRNEIRVPDLSPTDDVI